MIKLLAFLSILAILGPGKYRWPMPVSYGTGCGVERVHIKQLADPQASLVDFTHPVSTTVALLRSLSVPLGYNKYNDTTRYMAELHVYQVKAQLVGWKIESDHDYHIVIRDPNASEDQTMIAESIDPTCPLATAYATYFRDVRQSLSCLPPPTPRFTRFTSVTAVLTGVGYFDPIHGQTGVAPNGFELHPLLSVQIIQGCSP